MKNILHLLTGPMSSMKLDITDSLKVWINFGVRQIEIEKTGYAMSENSGIFIYEFRIRNTLFQTNAGAWVE